MSLSFSLNNRKNIERRMNLRLTTVNQRLPVGNNRKVKSRPQTSDAIEFQTQLSNNCVGSQELQTRRKIDAQNQTQQVIDCQLAKGDKLEGKFEFQNDSHINPNPIDMICCKSLSDRADEHANCDGWEQNQDGVHGMSKSSSKNQASAANLDLNCESSVQYLEPTSKELKMNQRPTTKDRRRVNQTLDSITKRIRSTTNDLVESHSTEETPICRCREQYNLDSRTLANQPKTVDNNDFCGTERSSQHNRVRNRILVQPHKLVSLSERNGRAMCNKHMPWFGIDVGGSLVKVVFFDPKDANKEETVTLKRIRRYLRSSKAYGTTGKRDAHLEMPNCIINKRTGTLHFIRFATSQMPDFLAMAKNKRFTDTINNVCATGGGAEKFDEDIKSNLGITLHKTDELDSIIHGIHYIDKNNSERECYFLRDPLDDDRCVKVPYDFSRPYPYMVVNIGSGVSILAVYSSTSYSRISGSSIGGGTFLGLCCLLTQCKTFDEAIRLANNGSSTQIDKLVKDIYGGDYPKFNLSGDTVASSFGHMNVAEKRKGVKREDLARALLEMVTINIGSISRMCAVNENIDRVVFIGNFLRVNQLSMKLLSYAVNYWSKGAIKALFLEHEGYFGAVGCFVESTNGCCHN